MSADPNRLLYAMSAHGEMTWAQYSEAIDVLSGGNAKLKIGNSGASFRSHILQSMQALGHCDVIYRNGRSTISIVPAALCRLPKAGLPIAVLIGARWLDTWKLIKLTAEAMSGTIQLKAFSNIDRSGLLPDTIIVEFLSEDVMADYCRKLQIKCVLIPPSWTLVNWCAGLLEFQQTLDFRIPSNLNWPRFDLSMRSLDLIRPEADLFPRFSRYINPVTSLPQHTIFLSNQGAEVDVYWGRYLLFRELGATVTAYDEQRYRLCVPLKAPLPAIISRAICLCSGRPPRYISRERLVHATGCSDWLLFDDVPPQIVVSALSNVGQVPERVIIDD